MSDIDLSLKCAYFQPFDSPELWTIRGSSIAIRAGAAAEVTVAHYGT